MESMEVTVVEQRYGKGERKFSEHEKSRFLLNADATTISWGTHKKYDFKCGECSYIFNTEIRNVTTFNRWCPCCSTTSKQLCDRKECKRCEEKSFALHPKAKYWSDRNELTPRQVHKNSEIKVWFDCDECSHEFYMCVKSVSNGHWCNFCGSKELCEDVNCETCFKKSFASHPLSDSWSYRNSKSPRQVFLNCNTKYSFDCKKCFHPFDIRPLNINQLGQSCPICCNRQRCGSPDCKFCFDHSFASHPAAQFWSTKNKVAPITVALNCEKAFWFHCPDCKQEYEQSPHHKVGGKKCPECKRTTQKLLYDRLRDLFLFELQWEKNFTWCINPETGFQMRYDITALDIDYILEVDGDHHFKQIRNWGNFDIIQEKDRVKMRFALEHGFRIIRIYQPDVWYDIEWAVAAVEAAMQSSDKVIFLSKSPDRYIEWSKHEDLW